MTSVSSGTARGKDYVTAVACMCFMYLTPRFDKDGVLVDNTKVAMTAPRDAQVKNIMVPEISRLYQHAKRQGIELPGRLVGYDIRTGNKEWFLTGFKADSHTTEAWTGFHAVNTMFAVTEATGIPQLVWDAIEGNLQGNSRLLIVFNPNVSIGYAAASQKSSRFTRFRLSSLTAPNVANHKKILAGEVKAIPGQVDYNWVLDKVNTWCRPIEQSDYLIEEGDFHFEIEGITRLYRPNDLFRVKVLGMMPLVSSDVLIPLQWIELANKRWLEEGNRRNDNLRLGIDIAGEGRDSSVFCFRYGYYVSKFVQYPSTGKPEHMAMAGRAINALKENTEAFTGKQAQGFIDTIGEGAGTYSRMIELEVPHIYPVKNSYGSEYGGSKLHDNTGQREFLNMRAYMYWALRDWLNPDYNTGAMLPVDDELTEELTEIRWDTKSSGQIFIEPKEDIKQRLGRSPDKADALTMTFYPVPPVSVAGKSKTADLAKYFF